MSASSAARELVGSVEDFEPLWDYVLVKVIQREEASPGGVLMPDNYAPKMELKRAKVIKAGKGAYRESGAFIPNPIKEGDIISMIGHTGPCEVFVRVDGSSNQHYLLAGRDCVAIEKSKSTIPCCPPDVGCSNDKAEPGRDGY